MSHVPSNSLGFSLEKSGGASLFRRSGHLLNTQYLTCSFLSLCSVFSTRDVFPMGFFPFRNPFFPDRIFSTSFSGKENWKGRFASTLYPSSSLLFSRAELLPRPRDGINKQCQYILKRPGEGAGRELNYFVFQAGRGSFLYRKAQSGWRCLFRQITVDCSAADGYFSFITAPPLSTFLFFNSFLYFGSTWKKVGNQKTTESNL